MSSCCPCLHITVSFKSYSEWMGMKKSNQIYKANDERMNPWATNSISVMCWLGINMISFWLQPGWFLLIWFHLMPFAFLEIYMNVPVGAAGVRGLGGRGYLAYAGVGRGCTTYQLKTDKRPDDKLYDLLPGMELTPMNPVTLKLQGIKHAPQVRARKTSFMHFAKGWHNETPLVFLQILEDICQKNNWGQPVYQLHSAIGPDQRQLFLYKVTIPALASQYPNMYVTTSISQTYACHEH